MHNIPKKDKKKDFYFFSRIECETDEVISIDIRNWNYGCVPERDGNCPGKGGVVVGCLTDEPPIPPQQNCVFEVNPFNDGECGCDNQVRMSNNLNQ